MTRSKIFTKISPISLISVGATAALLLMGCLLMSHQPMIMGVGLMIANALGIAEELLNDAR